MTLESYKYAQSGKVLALGALTQGNSTEDIHVVGIEDLQFEFIVASIGTNIKIRVEISLDGTNWVNADHAGVDTIIEANGSYSMKMNLGALYWYAKFSWISTSGGSPTIVSVNATMRK